MTPGTYLPTSLAAGTCPTAGSDTAAAQTEGPAFASSREPQTVRRCPACSQRPRPPSFLCSLRRDAGAHLHRHLLPCPSASAPPVPRAGSGRESGRLAVGAWLRLPSASGGAFPRPPRRQLTRPVAPRGLLPVPLQGRGLVETVPGNCRGSAGLLRDFSVQPPLTFITPKGPRQTTTTIWPLPPLIPFSLWPKAKDHIPALDAL